MAVVDERYGERYFGGDGAGEEERLTALAAVFDPVTRSVLEAAGVREGWRCLEVGPGSGTVSAWLAERVGPAGSVVAVDRETRFLKAAEAAGATVCEAQLTPGEPWPEPVGAGGFDLVHARLTVMHQHDRPAFLAGLVSLLRPGGVLVVGDTAELGGTSSAHPGYRATMTALSRFMADSIASDTFWGRHYPAALVDAGLTRVTLEAAVPVVTPGGPLHVFWDLTLRQVADRLVAQGYVSAPEVESALRHLADPATRELSFVLCTATGRRPE